MRNEVITAVIRAAKGDSIKPLLATQESLGAFFRRQRASLTNYR